MCTHKENLVGRIGHCQFSRCQRLGNNLMVGQCDIVLFEDEHSSCAFIALPDRELWKFVLTCFLQADRTRLLKIARHNVFDGESPGEWTPVRKVAPVE